MRKSIWYNNNINFFIEYKPINKKNKITTIKNNSLFTINKYSISSTEQIAIFFNLYKKLEFNYIYFLYYILLNKYKQHLFFTNKNIINFLFYKVVYFHLFKFI